MEWINLNKQRPTPFVWILGLTPGMGIYQIRRVNPNEDFTGQKNTDWMLPAYLRDDVIFTHWMPLPEMPKD